LISLRISRHLTQDELGQIHAILACTYIGLAGDLTTSEHTHLLIKLDLLK